MVRRRAVERLTSDLGSWNGAPVFAYGFEDLTGAEWRLIEALAESRRGSRLVAVRAGPCRVRIAEAGRPTTSPRWRTARSWSCPPRSQAYLPGAIAHLERHLFEDWSRAGPARRLDPLPRRGRPESHARAPRRDDPRSRPGRRRAGARSRSSAPPSSARGRRSRRPSGRSGCRSRSRVARGSARRRSASRCCRCSGSRGATGRGETSFAFLRTPYGGLGRSDVDFLEGRLRGRAVLRGERTIEETTKLRTGRPLADPGGPRSGRRPAGRSGRGGRGDVAQRLRARRTADDDGSAARPAGCGRCPGRARRAPAARRGRRGWSQPTTYSSPSTARPCAATVRAFPGVSPSSTSPVRGRGRSRRCS